MNRHGRSIAILLVLLVAAAACGGRLTEDEMRAELSTDGFSGAGGAAGSGDGGGIEGAATAGGDRAGGTRNAASTGAFCTRPPMACMSKVLLR